MNSASSLQADGYVTDIAYVAGYYRHLNPVIQALALNAQGVNAWRRGTPMTYLELGCGYGLSTLVHAAANPEATFIAIDIMPEHIAPARALAAAAGLANVTFIEGRFADLLGMNLPECDVIAMHGVWSWINAANRAHILQSIDSRLKTGGVVYLSYNTLPGCAAALPLRKLMMEEFAAAKGSVPERVATAVARTDAIKSVGGGFFADNPMAAQRFDDLKRQSRNYLAHEYFNADWQAFYHQDVAASFDPLGLAFVNQADLLQTIDDFHFSGPAREQIGLAPAATMRETLKDFFANRQFRADLFARRSLPTENGLKQLSKTPFLATVSPDRIDLVKLRTTLGEVAPARDPSVALLKALQDRPLSPNELVQHPACRDIPPKSLLGALYTLAAFFVVEPALPRDDGATRTESARRLNRAIWEKNLGGLWTEVNASPVTGGGVEVSLEDQMYHLARARGDDPVKFTAKVLKASEATIRDSYRAFLEQRLPAYQRIGIG